MGKVFAGEALGSEFGPLSLKVKKSEHGSMYLEAEIGGWVL